MKKIITISREFGAGGGEIGRKVAQKLGYTYIDKTLILKIAQESNLDVQLVSEFDEKVPANFGFAQSLFDFYNKPLNEKLFQLQKEVIRNMAEKGNCVIVGRNANSILCAFDSTLHIFIHADLDWRVNRITKAMPDESHHRILESTKTVDRRRKKYCSYYTNTTFGSSSFYDLSINTSSIDIDTAVNLICLVATDSSI